MKTNNFEGDKMVVREMWFSEDEKKRKEFQKKVERKINALLAEYEQEYEETPWYQNTSNCILEGIIDELKSIDVSKIDYGAEGCYFGGRIEVLERIKKELIFGDDSKLERVKREFIFDDDSKLEKIKKELIFGDNND